MEVKPTPVGELAVPMININGSSKPWMLQNYRTTLHTLDVLRLQLGQIAPHGRDYQTAPEGALDLAMAQHRQRYEALTLMTQEIEYLAECVQKQEGGR